MAETAAGLEALQIQIRALQLEAHRMRVYTMALELFLVASNTDRDGMARVVRELAERRLAVALGGSAPDEEVEAGADELRAFAERLERLAAQDREERRSATAGSSAT